MKFMVSWSIDQEQWLPVLKKWSSMTPAERATAGDGVKIVGRWHDLAARGVEFEQPPRYNAEFDIYHCFIRDPDGYLVEVQRFESADWPG